MSPEFSDFWSGMPEFSGFDSDDWSSVFSLPEDWDDLSSVSFDGFPKDWGSTPDSTMKDWEDMFNAFRDQAVGQSRESAFPDWDSSDFAALKDAFQKSGTVQETPETKDIRDLFNSAFGNIGNPELITPELPDSFFLQQKATGYAGSSGYRQLSAISAALGESTKPLAMDSLGALPDYTAPDTSVSARELFSESVGNLATSIDVSSDRYCSLYSSGKNNLKNTETKENNVLESLYNLLKK